MDKDELRGEFKGQADWRRVKAVEYPDDMRNERAAGLFDRLAASVDQCPDEVIVAAGELFDGPQDAEVWRRAMKDVGIDTWPESAEEFCRAFISERTTGA